LTGLSTAYTHQSQELLLQLSKVYKMVIPCFALLRSPSFGGKGHVGWFVYARLHRGILGAFGVLAL
jgi:hypothetical protein